MKRYKPYSELNPINSPRQPFYIIAIDFIVALLSIDSLDTLLIVIDKFTKRLALILG